MTPDDGLWFAVPFLAGLLFVWIVSMAGITEHDEETANDDR